nr:hypothetical protein [Tanacetum cinerariifolium]
MPIDPFESENKSDEGNGDLGEAEDNIQSIGTSNDGFGYVEENKCATTDSPGVWDSYIATHKRAAKLRDKKLANYPELSLIFQKDRAQGNRSKLVTEMQDEVNNEEQEQNSDDAFDEAMKGSHNARTNMSGVEEILSVRSKKRKNMGNVVSLVEVANNAAILLGDRIKESSSELSEAVTTLLVNCDVVNPSNLLWASLSLLLQTPLPESLTPSLKQFDVVTRICDVVSTHCMPS